MSPGKEGLHVEETSLRASQKTSRKHVGEPLQTLDQNGTKVRGSQSRARLPDLIDSGISLFSRGVGFLSCCIRLGTCIC